MTFSQALMMYAMIIVNAVIVVGLIAYAKRQRKKQERASALTYEVERLPGESLRGMIEDELIDLMGVLGLAIIVPMLVFYAFKDLSSPKLPYFWMIDYPLKGIILIVLYGILFYRIRLGDQRLSRMRFGLDAEIATAQELQKLTREGYILLHDIVMKGQKGRDSNIDHVLLTPVGIYTIETKHRGVLKDKKYEKKVRVDYEKGTLRFPDHSEDIPLKQLQHQARYLSETLSQLAGRKIEVKPLLALPGWFIDGMKQPKAYVFNPKNCGWFFREHPTSQTHSAGELEMFANRLREVRNA